MALINPHRAFWHLAAVQLIVDAGTGKPAHVVFRLRRRRKASLAGEFKVLPVSEVDMPLPGPRLGFTILAQYSYKGLIAVRVDNLVSGSFFSVTFHKDYFNWRRAL